jgi:pimeloyl-ACP methyl ester carboxylesterase
MLHGIYGRGRNWLGIARNVVEARPEYACWLVDLPHHGDSGPGAHGDSIEGVAADVEDWLRGQALRADVVLGHSYGGKVALALAARRLEGLRQVWVIDSTPEVKPASGSAWEMLRIVASLPSSFRTREEAVQTLVANGMTLGVSQWMSTNLARSGDRFEWRLDFDVMARLLDDFFVTELWDVLEGPDGPEIHLLKASESSAISTDAERRIEAASGSRVHLHRREGGHWIHADRPDEVTALLVAHLP